jgi:hypothetical protein
MAMDFDGTKHSPVFQQHTITIPWAASLMSEDGPLVLGDDHGTQRDGCHFQPAGPAADGG